MRVAEKRLRERIKALEEEKRNLEIDREKFRSYVIGELKRAITQQGQNSGLSPSVSIERIAKFLQSVKSWYW